MDIAPALAAHPAASVAENLYSMRDVVGAL